MKIIIAKVKEDGYSIDTQEMREISEDMICPECSRDDFFKGVYIKEIKTIESMHSFYRPYNRYEIEKADWIIVG